jgi:hypothetical protein
MKKNRPLKVPTKRRDWLEAECLKRACQPLGEVQYVTIRRIGANDGGSNWKVADIIPQPSLRVSGQIRDKLAALTGIYALEDEIRHRQDGVNVMRRAILVVSVGLCGCAADDEMRVLSYTPAGIEYSAWTGAYSRQAMADMAQPYCQREGKNARIIDSEIAEKNLFKGSRVAYRFNCVR